jgi:hypothetical protein
MDILKKLRYLLLLAFGVLLISTNALAVEYSPGYRIKTAQVETEIGYTEVAATLHLPGNGDIKGVAETGAAYNYLGIALPDGKSFEIGLTKDKYDLQDGRWSVFAYANYEGAFSYYGTEGRWVNFRRDGAVFNGPILTVPDGSTVNLSLKVLKKNEVVFDISGFEPLYIKMPGADPQGEKQAFRRVTSLVTDDPQGFFKNTRWSAVKIKKGQEPYTEWEPGPAEVWLSNNMDKNDPSSSWVSVTKDKEKIETINISIDNLTRENKPYAFEIQSKSDETMRVQFVGNQMYHEGRYLGFGINGKPMLSFRYIAERFGFRVDYDPQTGTSLVKNGEYGFQIKPGSKLAEIYWAGEKVKEKELTEKPQVKNNVLYLYSLDISDLLGLIPYWDQSAKTWDILYRDYTYQELAFPTAVNDNVLTIKGLLFDDGQHSMPLLEITDMANEVHSYSSSVGLKEQGIDSEHKYEMSSNIQLKEAINRLKVTLTIGQRIIFAKNIEVAVNIEAKELVVNPLYQSLYQFSSPTKGYIKVTQPEIIISGKVADTNTYPPEVVVFVRKSDNQEVLLEKRVPVTDGQFKHQLNLVNGEGLYKVTVNSIMAGPHGPVYPEITNFYVKYHSANSEV